MEIFLCRWWRSELPLHIKWCVSDLSTLNPRQSLDLSIRMCTACLLRARCLCAVWAMYVHCMCAAQHQPDICPTEGMPSVSVPSHANCFRRTSGPINGSATYPRPSIPHGHSQKPCVEHLPQPHKRIWICREDGLCCHQDVSLLDDQVSQVTVAKCFVG